MHLGTQILKQIDAHNVSNATLFDWILIPRSGPFNDLQRKIIDEFPRLAPDGVLRRSTGVLHPSPSIEHHRFIPGFFRPKGICNRLCELFEPAFQYVIAMCLRYPRNGPLLKLWLALSH